MALFSMAFPHTSENSCLFFNFKFIDCQIIQASDHEFQPARRPDSQCSCSSPPLEPSGYYLRFTQQLPKGPHSFKKTGGSRHEQMPSPSGCPFPLFSPSWAFSHFPVIAPHAYSDNRKHSQCPEITIIVDLASILPMPPGMLRLGTARLQTLPLSVRWLLSLQYLYFFLFAQNVFPLFAHHFSHARNKRTAMSGALSKFMLSATELKLRTLDPHISRAMFSIVLECYISVWKETLWGRAL